MNRLGINLASNVAGKGLTALISFALVPVYIHLLGIESFGLIGFFATLQAATLLLDLGLSTTINREMACRSVKPDGLAGRRDLLRTFEVINWLVAVALGLGLWLLAPLIAKHWVNPGELDRQTVVIAVQMMGLALACKWPSNAYNGALMGLQHQVSMNVIGAASAVIAGGGAVVVLVWIAPKVEAFFAWQFLVNGLFTLITGAWTWHCLHEKQAASPRFQAIIIKDTWRFSAGVSGVTVLGMILTQMDKIVLSAILSLEDFGYYSVAAMVAGGLSTIVNPVFTAVFPSFVSRVGERDDQRLAEQYHRSARMMATLIFPPVVLIAWFSSEILLLWTGSHAIAATTGLVLSVLIVGSGLNGIMTVPWALQLAHGYLKLGLLLNALSIVMLLPLVIIGAQSFGGPGAATGWLILNLSYVVLAIPLMHRKFLPGQQWRWYGHDNLVPLLGVIGVTVLADLAVRGFDVPVGLAVGGAIVGAYFVNRRFIYDFAVKEGR